jgi:hypothetical protein
MFYEFETIKLYTSIRAGPSFIHNPSSRIIHKIGINALNVFENNNDPFHNIKFKI